MKLEYYGKECEVFEITKKGGKHLFYTIFDKESTDILDDDTQEFRPIAKSDEEFVKKIRVDGDRYLEFDINDFPISIKK